MDMHSYRVLVVPILVVALSSASHAGGKNRAGTSAAPQLLIPVGARYLAMNGSAGANATGLEAIFWNPAGIDLTERPASALFSQRSYIADMGVSYFAASGKFDLGSVALSLRSFSVGDIAVTTEEAPDGTGEIINPTFFVLGFSYSRRITDRISVGATLNVIHENFSRVGVAGIAFDAGVQYASFMGVENLAIGVVVKNVGPPMRYGGSGLFVQGVADGSSRQLTSYKVEAAAFELPSVIELGLAYRISVGGSNHVQLAGIFQNNNFAYDEYRLGLEYTYENVLSLRGGYLLASGVGEQAPNIFQNFTMGGGLNFQDVGGVHLTFDYVFIPVKWFDTNHAVSIGIGF